MPTAAIARNTKSPVMFLASAVARVARPKIKTLPMTIRLDPILSASGLMKNPPITPPNTPALKTGPKAAGAMPHSLQICGAAKAIAWISKPSAMHQAAHIAIIHHCRDEIGVSSISRSTSTTSLRYAGYCGTASDLLGRKLEDLV
jgi:hypothetical protein